jgi:Cu/Ag efflux protein CusF
MKKFLSILAILALASLTWAGQAAETSSAVASGVGTAGGTAVATAVATGASAPATTDMASGEVRKVYTDTPKILIKHGEIKNLDMPPMTMVFNLKDKAMADRLKAGDKVRFKAAQVGGEYTVTEIEIAP